MSASKERRRPNAEPRTRVDVRPALPQVFEPLNTVRCVGAPVFRHQAARDAACLLDVDHDVIAWSTSVAPIFGEHVPILPDLQVTYPGRTEFLVVVHDDDQPSEGLGRFAQCAGSELKIIRHSDIHDDRLENAKELLRYARWSVSLSDRVRLLAFLEQEGSVPLAECLSTIRSGRDPIAAIAALCLHRFVDLDLDSGRIGPQTRVAPFRG